ncbi:hypothetical protein SIN8267_02866 [Sinobacterium norvegicum]|uniref:Uncharacterized protein n=1 Tax=Sinobacterium norvegicum TaxID=1641715 RepID=A0ABM9AHN3_9GAMM|nr:hypothetical protein [Sinobacterium norvegicum]CAH0992730.1 hypothetical protein SIN8267_02866 [Sinobacterium norvegicum]
MSWDISEAFPIDGLAKYSPLQSKFIAQYVKRAQWELQREQGVEVPEWEDSFTDPVFAVMQDANFNKNPVDRAKRLLLLADKRKAKNSDFIA